MTYSSLAVDSAFSDIWEVWLNKDGEKASEKALHVAVKQGADLQLITAACKIYALENVGQEFTHKLSNFILNDVWRDVVEGHEDIASYQRHLESRRKEAIEVIETWNTKRKDHWCPALDIEARIPVSTKALKDKFFKNNWKKALDKAVEIFKYKPRENDRFKNLILSLTWFCDTSPNKHAVLKILEGQYGFPQRDIAKRYPKRIEISDEEAKRIAEENKKLFQDVFGSKTPPTQSSPDEEEDVGIY